MLILFRNPIDWFWRRNRCKYILINDNFDNYNNLFLDKLKYLFIAYLDILVHNLIGLCLITSRGLTFLASQTSLLASVQNSSSSKCGINCQTGWQNWCFSNSQVSSPTWLTICKVCNIIKSPKNREEMRLTVLGLSWQVSLIVKGHISFPHTSRWTCLQPVCGTARSRITSLTSHC